ncbi:MAG TPA: TetR/AcrR family transcriptional regulator [Syntrophomonadaceae bacterium]|nr:TetR/AcrR family transcriptional regulator [Syntrophomonadaceae bacterium]
MDKKSRPANVDRRVRKTKKNLKESLATLLLEKNINDITVQELVNRADINRGTFYLHYRDIYDMLSQIEAEMLEELDDISRLFPVQQPKESPGPYISAMFQYIADNQTFCKMLLGPFGDMAFVEKLKTLVKEKCLRSLMETWPASETQRYEYFASYAVAGCIGLLQTWMDTGMKESPQELAKVAEGMINNGIDYLNLEKAANESY